MFSEDTLKRLQNFTRMYKSSILELLIKILSNDCVLNIDFFMNHFFYNLTQYLHCDPARFRLCVVVHRSRTSHAVSMSAHPGGKKVHNEVKHTG